MGRNTRTQILAREVQIRKHVIHARHIKPGAQVSIRGSHCVHRVFGTDKNGFVQLVGFSKPIAPNRVKVLVF